MARTNTAIAAVQDGAVRPKAPRPFRTIIPLVNNRELKARRRLFAEAVATARRNVEAAEERQRRYARSLVVTGSAPRLGALEPGRLKREVDEAKAELAAQEEALASIDEQLKPYTSPERQAAAAEQREGCRAALDDHWRAIDDLESLVKEKLVAQLREVFASRKRAAAQLGAVSLGVLGDMTGDPGLTRRLSELIGGALYGLIDAQTVAFYAGNGVKHDRRWSDCERTHLGQVDFESLE